MPALCFVPVLWYSLWLFLVLSCFLSLSLLFSSLFFFGTFMSGLCAYLYALFFQKYFCVLYFPFAIYVLYFMPLLLM